MSRVLVSVVEAADLLAAPMVGAERLSQVLAGEPVLALDAAVGQREGWVEVRSPWQPSSRAAEGYPGWVRAEDLAEADPTPEPPAPRGASGPDLLRLARGYLGTPYAWGGMTAAGIDCSGLVHVVARVCGLVVPRDAVDQAPWAEPVSLDAVRPGDLWFFARPGKPVHHVGLVSDAGADPRERWLLHAPDSGPVHHVVEEPLRPERVETLVAAGRISRAVTGGPAPPARTPRRR